MAVTVAELIEGLKSLDPELIVVLSSDEEGNTFKSMDEAMSIGTFYDDGPREGQFVNQSEEEESEDDEDDNFDLDVDAQPAVVFWPVG